MASEITWGALIVDALPNLVGTAIGGAIALFLYVYRLNRGRKQILRSALFNLIEVWEITRKLVRFDPEKAVHLLFEEMSKKFEEAPPLEQLRQHEEWAEQIEQLKPMLEIAVRQTILQINPDELNELTARYRESIIHLSAEEPLLAHSLYREYNLEQIEGALDGYFSYFASAMDDEENVSDFQSLAKNTVNEKVLARMEADLEKLAWKAGPVLWWKTTKKIDENAGPEPDFSDEQMSEVMDLMEEVLESGQANGNSPKEFAS